MIGERLAEHVEAAKDSVDEVRRRGTAWAEAERDYRKAKAAARAVSRAPSQAAINAEVEDATQRERYARDMAHVLYESAREALRVNRDTLSAYQSWAAAVRQEMEFERVGPQVRGVA